MAKTFQDLMAETRRSIREVSLEDLKARLEAPGPLPFTLVDVREGEEYMLDRDEIAELGASAKRRLRRGRRHW